MADQALASVVVAPGTLEVQQVSIPDGSADAGLLRVERTGVCGTDVRDLPRGDLPKRIMGHEIVGTVAGLGAQAQRRWGLAEGDRILLEEYLPCGICRACRSGDYRLCEQTDILTSSRALRYGATPLDVAPGLWGGYSQYVYLHPQTVFHRVPDGVPPELAPMAIPMSNGYEWAYKVGGAAPSEPVVILGPGQQGLSCLLAARIAGAGPVIVAGLGKDAARLAIARELGADRVVDLERESLVDVVAEATSGRMASVAIDTAACSEASLRDAMSVLAKNGRLVICARNDRPIPVNMGVVRAKTLTVTGVRGHSYQAVEWALAALVEHAAEAARLSAGTFGLADLYQALAVTGDGSAIHVSVDPWK